MNNREKILHCALDLFSVRGFDAVSLRDIASAVGIKESSLYNHFKNKQDIFDTIVTEYGERGGELFHSMDLTNEERQFAVDEKTIGKYQQMTNEQFIAMTSVVFDYYFTDEINVKLRRMLTIEQYRNDDIAHLFRRISFDDAIEYQSKLFAAMMEAGLFVKADPYVLALEFFAPVFLIFYKYDNNEKSLAEARELFIRHIGFFQQISTLKPGEKAI